MRKEKRAVHIILSSREVVARDLPHPTPLFNEKKQSCFTEEVEDPRTLRQPPGEGAFFLSKKK